jgi:hypothetical protein
MFFTHTHRHECKVGNNQEFLELSLTGGPGLEGQGLLFVNDDYRMGSHPDHKRLLMRIKFGVLDELQRAGFTSFLVNISTCRYLDIASPEWLFEVVARRCVVNGLNDPNAETSEVKGKKPRPKDKPLLASAEFSSAAPISRTRASLIIGEHASNEAQTVRSWLQRWRGEVTLAGYSTGGWDQFLDVEGPQEALDELPTRLFTSSQWVWKTGDDWEVYVSPGRQYLNERTLNMLYETGLNSF